MKNSKTVVVPNSSLLVLELPLPEGDTLQVFSQLVLPGFVWVLRLDGVAVETTTVSFKLPFEALLDGICCRYPNDDRMLDHIIGAASMVEEKRATID